MTTEEQFTEIITKQQGDLFMPFLKVLSSDQKKLLVAPIKKISKEYSQFGDLGGGRYGNIKGTDKQRNMLQIASFVCLNRIDYEKSPYSVWILEENNLKGLIDWYVPGWLSDFVNKQADRDFVPYYLSYNWIMQLTEKGALNPSKELLVKSIPQMIFESHDNKWQYKPENLLKRPITLQEHIWYLFEVESNLHYSDRFLYFGKDVSKEALGWKLTFITYSLEGKIDRPRLLKESLLAANKNFNKVLSGWFAQLFTDLQPAKEELLHLQKELFSVLNSPHSKPVNTALQMIKKIVGENAWNIPEFLDAVPILLASDTKATVASALMILEKIAKKHKEYREKIGVHLCQVFVHPDEELQAKAAKLIMANRESLHESFREELSPFYGSMLASAKKILETIVPDTNIVQIASFSEVPVAPRGELQEIPQIETIDDLIFLASQVFDNNATWHIDQLAAALVKFLPLLTPEDIPRFEPAFQRAFGLTKNGLRSDMGHLEQLLAMFFIDFGNYLIRNFPGKSDSIKNIYTKHDSMDGEMRRSWTVSPENSSYTERWEMDGKIAAYQPYKQLLATTLKKITKGDDMPVLCVPTHAPGWIMPEILIDRLCIYQQKNKEPDSMDLQVAISRCYLKNTGTSYNYAHEKLSGEFQNIMHFLLDEKNAEPKGPFVHKAAWMVASLTKKEKKQWPAFESFSYYKKPFANYTGNLAWESIDEEHTYDRYDYEAKKYVPKKDRRKILRVFKDHSEKKEKGLKKILAGFLPAAKDDPPLLYDYLTLRTKYLSVEQNDIKRIMLLAPGNPEPMLTDIINQCLGHPKFWEETSKKLVIAALQLLYEIWDDYGEMAHVFIGTCMISSDKTVANIAGEIWLNAATNNKINNEKLGEVIGLHERIEFAPLKRFTDLVIQQLFRISDKHNPALEKVIVNILKLLPAEPITNLKKLLEIYSELLAVNNSAVTDQTIKSKLEDWKKLGSLKKLIEALI